MGHIASQGVYQKLRKRLDKNPIGAPESKTMYEILRTMYTTEEADIASRMPMRFSTLKDLSKKTNMDIKTLEPVLENMAEKGLVFDLERNQKKYFMLSPTIIGFIEFSLMRVTDKLNQKKLGKLYKKLFKQDDVFVHDAFQGETQIGRALANETTLREEDYAEILDYEKASYIIDSAEKFSVGLCCCRHSALHNGEPCTFAPETCMSFNNSADFLIRRGLAREISKEKAKEIFEQSRSAGLVQVGDNVKRNFNYLCNCCGCCCGQLGGFKKLKPFAAVHSSNFIAKVNVEKCNGCGLCAKKCQVEAMAMKHKNENLKGKEKERPANKYAEVHEDYCLGCGICAHFCKAKAVDMLKRKVRVYTPENTFERTVLQFLERGKINELLFDGGNNDLGSYVMNVAVKTITNLPFVKRTLLQKQVKSKFLEVALNKVNHSKDKWVANV